MSAAAVAKTVILGSVALSPNIGGFWLKNQHESKKWVNFSAEEELEIGGGDEENIISNVEITS